MTSSSSGRQAPRDSEREVGVGRPIAMSHVEPDEIIFRRLSDAPARNAKRRVFALLLTFVFFLIATGFAVWLMNDYRDDPVLREEEISSGLGLFALVNVNIIAVMVLGFLVLKNIFRLILDRRRGILGSKLRSRLVVAFVGLSLIPTVLLFVVAKGIVETVLQGWFSPQIAASVNGAVEIAKTNFDTLAEELERKTHYLAENLPRSSLSSNGANPGPGSFEDVITSGSEPAAVNPALLNPVETARGGKDSGDSLSAAWPGRWPGAGVQMYLERKAKEYGLRELRIAVIASERGAIDSRFVYPFGPDWVLPIDADNLRTALAGQLVVKIERGGTGDALRAYHLIRDLRFSRTVTPDFPSNGYPKAVLITAMDIQPALSRQLNSVLDAYDDYKELRTYRRPLASSYLLTLVVVTLMVVFAAIWFGFYLARTLAVPIQLLAHGTEEVAQGNLSHRIPEVGDDELSVLVRSFNTMTEDLQQTTGELVQGRRYMETVLASLGVGICSVDKDGKITTLNVAAADMFGIHQRRRALLQPYQEFFPQELNQTLSEALDRIWSRQEVMTDSSVSLTVDGVVKHLQLTVNSLENDDQSLMGAVILVDDLTELVSAQRMNAWREVARRIAHEIKNPLTPIQLSAQRIKRRFGEAGAERLLTTGEQTLIGECTDVIVGQVETLRSLVSEFSDFARMPRAKFQDSNFSQLATETITMFRAAHVAIQFSVELDSTLPNFEFDRDQLGRVLINLLDNAVASVSAQQQLIVEDFQPQIVVRVQFDSSLEQLIVQVLDNGIGISDEDKRRLFEPYFSTKKGGTGLGLAIASTIVSDHNGFLRVRDNPPHGVCFVMELPVRRQDQKRRAATF